MTDLKSESVKFGAILPPGTPPLYTVSVTGSNAVMEANVLALWNGLDDACKARCLAAMADSVSGRLMELKAAVTADVAPEPVPEPDPESVP